jgi:hypothetical protein
MIGPFGLRPKGTMSVRALPMAKALVARGHRVEMLLPPWSWPSDSGREWEEEGVRVVNITLPSPIPLLRHLIITGRLVRRALETNPDVVHCVKPKAYAGLAAMALWALKKLGLTRARLVVDSDDWEGPGGWNEIERYSWLEKRLFAFQERWGLTHCDGLTVASRALETLAWSLGASPGRVFYVPNGSFRIHDAGYKIQDAGCRMQDARASWIVHHGSWIVDRGSETISQQDLNICRYRALGPGPVILLYTRFF